MSDHYNLLGVSPDASTEEIRRAFRREAKRCHPDLFADRPPADRETQQRRFIQLAQAYQILSNPQQRQAYDRRLRGAGMGQAHPKAEPRPAAGETRARSGPTFRGGSGTQAKASAPPHGDPSRPHGGTWQKASSTSARAAGTSGRPSGSRTDGVPVDRAQELREILKEAERSLAKFGIDLRQPADVVLEDLLDWARALYRDLVGAVKGSPGGEKSSASGTAPGSCDTSRHAGTRSAAGSARQRSPEMDAGRLNELAVERELQQIKQGVRRGSSAKAPTVDEELAELKRRHGKQP